MFNETVSTNIDPFPELEVQSSQPISQLSTLILFSSAHLGIHSLKYSHKNINK